MSFLATYVEHFTYIRIFLLLAGLGVPAPQEGTIHTSGYLAYLDIIDFWMDLRCMLGILTRD